MTYKKYVCMVVLVLLAEGGVVNVSAYELATHGFLTHEAYNNSVLGDVSFLSELGLETNSTYPPLGINYYDVKGSQVIERMAPSIFSGSIIEGDLGLGEKTSYLPYGWLMRGAIREDDHNSIDNVACTINAPNENIGDPDLYPDPPSRPLHHFFDPVNDEGLFPVISEKAPDWAIGADDAFSVVVAANASRRNHFTVFDAREAMYRALTGRKTLGPEIDQDKIGPNGEVATRLIRNAYWATTFRALGDVVHLVEDMAQPQHTREDPHSGDCLDVLSGFAGHASFYERYIDARVKRTPEAVDRVNELGITISTPEAISLSYYPIPTFNRFSDYWSTREEANGRGLADFSNREFFTAGRNLGDREFGGLGSFYYDSPSNARIDYQIIPTWSSDKAGIINYLADTVTDVQLPGQQLTGLKTRESLFNDSLSASSRGDYSLDRTIYDVQAAFLLPRAVAYSAGLINYFFRGKLAISLPDEGIYGVIDHTANHAVINNVPKKGESGDGGVFGFEKIILNVSNITPDIDDGQSPPFVQNIGAGTFRAVAHYRYNPCYTPDLSGEARDVITGTLICDTNAFTAEPVQIATSEAVAVSAFDNNNPNRIEFDFSAEPIPINAVDLKIQVVFYGELGAEANTIAVGMKDISEPTFYFIRNTSDYFSLHEVFYKTDDPIFTAAANAEGIPAAQYAAYTAGPGTLTVGNAAGVVQVPSFESGEFIRIAYLADYDPISLVSYISPISGAYFTSNPRRVSVDPGLFQIISSVGDATNRLYGIKMFLMTHLPFPDINKYGDTTGLSLSNFPVPVEKPVTVCFSSSGCTVQ